LPPSIHVDPVKPFFILHPSPTSPLGATIPGHYYQLFLLSPLPPAFPHSAADSPLLAGFDSLRFPDRWPPEP